MTSAHKVHAELEYCASCYQREFVPKPCAGCGKPTRTLRTQTEPAKCHACMAAERQCIRCEKPLLRAALRVGSHYACAACASHFYEPKPCTNCGELAQRLSRAPALGFNTPICDKCRRKADHMTCSNCRKYKPFFALVQGDKKVCKECFDHPHASHSCPGCQTVVPGSGNSRCRACLNREATTQALTLQTASMSQPWCRAMTLEFGQWLWQLHPDKPALSTLAKKHAEFFVRLDAEFSDPEQLSGEVLAAKFTVRYLRRHLLCKRFLQERFQIVLMPAGQQKQSALDQIKAKLLTIESKPYGALLSSYQLALERSAVAALTRRLYLRAAENLCVHASLSPDAFVLPGLTNTQKRFQTFAKHHKGSYASACRFVKYLNLTFGAELVLTPSGSAVQRQPTTVKRLGLLIRAIKGVGIEDADTFSLLRLTGIALGLPNLALEQIEFLGTDGSEFVVNEERIEIPSQLRPYVRELNARSLRGDQLVSETT